MLKLNKNIITHIFTRKKISCSTHSVNESKKIYIKRIVNDYDRIHYQNKDGYNDYVRNKVGRIWHPIFNVYVAKAIVFNLLISKFDIAAAEMVIFFMQSGLDKMFHNIAMRKSATIVRMLKNTGIKDESDLIFAVDYYLKKNGGLVYSNIIRNFAPTQINKIVQGEKPSQIKGLMSWLQTKVTLGSYYNKPQMIKAKKNILKLGKNIKEMVTFSPSRSKNDNIIR